MVFHDDTQFIEHTIHKARAVGGAIIFCDFEVFVDGDFDGDGGAMEELCEGEFDDEQVHHSDPGGVPVVGNFRYLGFVGEAIFRGGGKQLLGEFYFF